MHPSLLVSSDLSEFIPAVSFALYAGHIIDLSEKRKLILRGVGLYGLAALLILTLSTPIGTSNLHPHIIAVFIYIIIFGTGVVRSFTGPVFSVMLAQVVPKNILQNAITWNTSAFLSASIAGHANRRIPDRRIGKYRYDDRGRPARFHFLNYPDRIETKTVSE